MNDYLIDEKFDDHSPSSKELRRRVSREFIDPYYIAIIYLGLGEQVQGLAWLDKTYEERSFWLLWMNVEPKFDRLHSDPRISELAGLTTLHFDVGHFNRYRPRIKLPTGAAITRR